MEGVSYIIAALLLISIFLYGYKIKKNITSILSRILFRKASNEVEKYLRNHQSISILEAKEIICDLKAWVFWSRRTIIIDNSLKYTKIVLDSMVGQGRLLCYEFGSSRIYTSGKTINL